MQNNHIPEDIQLLIVSYITDNIESSNYTRLKDWLQSNPENVIRFNQYTASWILAADSEKVKYDSDLLWNRIVNEIKHVQEIENRAPLRQSSFIMKMPYAAIWILVICLTSLVTWYVSKPKVLESQTTEYIVPKGSKSAIKLPDGSIVWLNAGSKLTYADDFGQKERDVYLTGEAHFTVVTNKEKPFRVHTSDLIVRALGTKFNVKAYPEEKIITTTLEEGIIDVQIIKGSQGNHSNNIKIKPNERLVFIKPGLERNEILAHKASEEVKKIQRITDNIKVELDVNTELYTSWHSDKWVIEGLTLKCLAPMLERRYNMKIHFANDGLEQYKFSGILQNETIEQILDVLRYTAPIKYNIVKDSIYLTVDHKVRQNFERIITTRK
jgi:ferric-dicitrate binding protein FerR (iron transport regulator)